MSQRQSRFLVRTSGSSGKKFKFILHDPLLFIKKYQRIGNHFQKTFAFSPAESIAGIETLLETVGHGNELVCAGDRVSPRTVSDLVQKYQIDYFQTTPTFLNLWMMSGELRPEKLGSLKKIAFGSEPPQRVVLNFLREKLPGIQLVHTYGMSEIGIQKTLTCVEDPTLLLLDEHFNPGRLNEGMIEVQSLTPMISYLNHPTEESPWFKTLDQAVEEKNFWRVKGRNSDMINLAGRKFFPIELEEILMDLPGILDVSVAREENEIIGNIIVATITISPDENEADFRKSLKSFCHERVPFYMHPQKVFLKKEIPMNPRFKKIRTI
jgi:acyl-coenzyme A synthetase/AMP-(fatty) acid ligase